MTMLGAVNSFFKKRKICIWSLCTLFSLELRAFYEFKGVLGYHVYAQKDTMISFGIAKQKCYCWGSAMIAQLVSVNNKILKKDTVGRLTQFYFNIPYRVKIIKTKSYWWGSEEIAQWLRALAQLARVLSSNLQNSRERPDCACLWLWHGKVGVRDR